MNHLRLPVALSIFAALVNMGLKAAAWQFTGSVGLLSDALESGVNLLAALTAYLSLLYAARPVDPTHTYGHEKIEFFSSGMEGVLIAVAAIGIFRTAILRLFEPIELQAIGAGVLISTIAALINLVVARVLLRAGRRHRSIGLEADGHHLMADVWTSAAVIAGLGLVWFTGVAAFDPVMAMLVAGSIAFTAYRLVRRSFNGLMDHALPEAEQTQLRSAIAAAIGEGTTFHALRTRQAGTRRFADCHLLVPGNWSVKKAHDLAERVERALQHALPGLDVTLHIEPIEADASYRDSALLGFEPKEPA
jgi:cation diffusion facilitator family transporter